MRCPKCDKTLEYKMFITENGEFRKTCQNCRHKKCSTKARSFMINFYLEEPAFQIDPLTGNKLNETPANISILRLKQVIKSLNAKEIYLLDHEDCLQALIIFRNTRSITAIRKLVPFSFVIFDTKRCADNMKIIKEFDNIINYANDEIKEIPYFTAKTKIDLEREKREIIRENKVQLQNLKNNFVDDAVSLINPALTYELEEFELLEDELKDQFWENIKDLVKHKVDDRDFTKIKSEIYASVRRQVQSDINKNKRMMSQSIKTPKEKEKENQKTPKPNILTTDKTEEEYIKASINVKNRSMGASVYYYTSRGYDEEKLRSYL